ncbi:hypothetical protein [Fibrella forsythiae]|uniref:KTSC domain-containing protein n=1 Tax=Fibrella forsythiae TaxID=2817061 RepID=A0ABS3JBH3_9BACT|nr:hypothetical protein [Fibrella forsythiae]MBO0947337.1 hypothetical protein [Fibrella forsythiae]
MKLPKRLDLTRSCFYQLPPEVDAVDLTNYELLFRVAYNGIFHSRVGRYYFFQLPSVSQRNEFMLMLEGMAKQKGLSVIRETIYPD